MHKTSHDRHENGLLQGFKGIKHEQPEQTNRTVEDAKKKNDVINTVQYELLLFDRDVYDFSFLGSFILYVS